MSADRPILSLNSHLEESAGIFSTKDRLAIDHFGNDVSGAPDTDILIEQEKSSDSMQLNHLKLIRLESVNTVLEISADFGSTTTLLQAASKKGFQHDVIKPEFFNALASKKCSKEDDLCAICDDFSSIDLPKKYYDFISLDCLALLGADQLSRDAGLKRLSEA